VVDHDDQPVNCHDMQFVIKYFAYGKDKLINRSEW